MTSTTTSNDPSGPMDVIDESTFQPLCDDVAGHLNAQMGRLLDLTIWLINSDNERHWAAHDVWRPHQYLAWRCAIGPTLAATSSPPPNAPTSCPHRSTRCAAASCRSTN